jgi:hypothetical protein
MNDPLHLRAHGLIDARVTVTEYGGPNARFQIHVKFPLLIVQMTIFAAYKISLDDLVTFQNVIHGFFLWFHFAQQPFAEKFGHLCFILLWVSLQAADVRGVRHNPQLLGFARGVEGLGDETLFQCGTAKRPANQEHRSGRDALDRLQDGQGFGYAVKLVEVEKEHQVEWNV